jgi:glycerophosphoryl diester phosphodiesterase
VQDYDAEMAGANNKERPLSHVLMPEMFMKKFHFDDTLRRMLTVAQAASLPLSTTPPQSRRDELPSDDDEEPTEGRQPLSQTNLKNELAIMRTTMQSLPPDVRSQLVAHRGFHCASDFTDRPIENSLQAMEQAWVNGFRYCECDVTITACGEIVLCHDTNLRRVSLLRESEMASQPVSALTFRDLVATPLKSGVRLPLLKDVLETAERLGGDASLVIELKSESCAGIGTAVARFLSNNPSLINRVGAVMSFDRDALVQFRSHFEVLQSCRAHDDCLIDRRPPALLLMCIPDTAVAEYELEVDIDAPDVVDTLTRLTHISDGLALDGMYLQYTETFVNRVVGNPELRKLARGVWGMEPDNADTARHLAQHGLEFVNTDLPRGFMDSTDEVFQMAL